MTESWMPAWADPFLNREEILRDMAACVHRAQERETVCRMYVHGLEGLGVSSLVTQFSKQHAGTLVWLTGRRADGTAAALGELLDRILRRLEVSHVDSFSTDAEKSDAFRALCRDRDILLVLDDMFSIAQLRGLIPEHGPRVVVVATGPFARRELHSELGFESFTPALLPQGTADELFRHLLGAETTERIPAPIRTELVAMCGGFPLLVRVLGARLRGRAKQAPRLLEQLRESRLHLLTLDSEQRMRTFLDAGYLGLEENQARAYRYLGSLPAGDLTPESAAAALDCDYDSAVLVLDELVDLNLLTESRERYAFHPVVRDDARARAHADEDADALAAVAERWSAWYLKLALPRGFAMSNRWWVSPVLEMLNRLFPDAIANFTRSEAQQWFDDELDNLVAAVHSAHRYAHHDTAWMLCVAMWKHLHLRGFRELWIDTHRDGLASARAVGDRAAIMQLTSQLGAGLLADEQFDEARACFVESLAAARDLSDVIGEQSALEWIGKIAARRGDSVAALDCYRQSWSVVAEADPARLDPQQRERALALLRLQQIRAWVAVEQWDRVRAEAPVAQDYFDRFDNETDNSAKVRTVHARAMLAIGETTAAIQLLEQAVDRFDRDNARGDQADTRCLLARAHLAAGHSDHAVAAYRAALAFYRTAGSPRADIVVQALAELGA